MRPVTVLDVLLEAAAVLDSEDRYTPTSRTKARDVDGDPCGYTTDDAYSFTLLGACKLAVHNLGISGQRDRRISYTALHAVELHLPCSRRCSNGRREWFETDWDQSTHAMIIEALDNAILGNDVPVKPAEITLEELALNPRTYNTLYRYGIRHAAHLVSLSRDRLERIPNVGMKTVSEIDAALATHGLALAAAEATR